MQRRNEQDMQIDSGQNNERRREEPAGSQQRVFKDRFKYEKQVNEGCFGVVYDVTDM